MGAAIHFAKTNDSDAVALHNTRANQDRFCNRSFRDVDLDEEHKFFCFGSFNEQREINEYHRREIAEALDERKHSRQNRGHSKGSQTGQRCRTQVRENACSSICLLNAKNNVPASTEHSSRNATSKIDKLKPLPPRISMEMRNKMMGESCQGETVNG